MKRPYPTRDIDPVTWFWQGFARSENGCLEWQRGLIKGYGRCQEGVGDGSRYSHRVAWFLTNGPIPNGLHVLHRCDNPLCSNVDHLFLGTHTDNVKDMVTKGRNIGGKRKLVGPQVLSILLRLDSGEAKGSIAARFGVSDSAIYEIAKGRNWSHYSL